MRIGVLAPADNWYLADLQRAAAGRYELVPLSYSRLGAQVDGSGAAHFICGEQPLDELDALLVRAMPPGSLEQIVFRMDVLARWEAAGRVVVNPPRAIEAAVDKYLACARMAAAGLPVPATAACQTVPEAMAAFERLGGDVVVKPLFGSEGRGMMRISDEELALRSFKALTQLGAVVYMQRFIQHEGCDIRVLVVGRQCLAMRRVNPRDWRTNVSRGASTEPLELAAPLAELATRAAACIGAPLAGVDILPASDGRHYVLEVNAAAGWKALARTLQVDVARLVLELVEQQAAAKARQNDQRR